MPVCFSLELSLVLSAIIAARLPTQEARPWRKALTPWYGYQGDILSLPPDGAPAQLPAKSSTVPEVSWPIEVVLYPYPGKWMYGRGEPILWELKLIGEQAEHELFLELILPAIEEAGRTTDSHWRGRNTLWGHFDIDAVYAGRGLQWEPFVQEGRLDLSYRPEPTQWAEGWPFITPPEAKFSQLTWLTPFAFDFKGAQPKKRQRRRRKRSPERRAPTLHELLTATEARLQQLTPLYRRRSETVEEVFAGVEPPWPEVLAEAETFSVRSHKLEKPPKTWPGDWLGSQTFAELPPVVIPYLNLAAILHVGRYAHFGCGTFELGK